QNGANDCVGPVHEWRDRHMACDRAAASIDRVDYLRDPSLLSDGTSAERLLESLRRQADVEAEHVLAAQLAFPQPPQIFSARIPDEDLEIRIDHDHGAAHARQNALEERVDLLDLVPSFAELVIHRLELPVSAGVSALLMASLEELKVAEEELRMQNAQLADGRAREDRELHHYRQLFTYSPAAALLTDRRGAILEANAPRRLSFAVKPSTSLASRSRPCSSCGRASAFGGSSRASAPTRRSPTGESCFTESAIFRSRSAPRSPSCPAAARRRAERSTGC